MGSLSRLVGLGFGILGLEVAVEVGIALPGGRPVEELSHSVTRVIVTCIPSVPFSSTMCTHGHDCDSNTP
jgi:hypothetical protein